MNSEIIARKTCRLCNSNQLKIIYELNNQPIGDDYTSVKKKSKTLPT